MLLPIAYQMMSIQTRLKLFFHILSTITKNLYAVSLNLTYTVKSIYENSTHGATRAVS